VSSAITVSYYELMKISAASFLHHVFVMSPDGQYLVRLIENFHRLIPYTVVKQTLRVGNAATMINGMVRLVLAKLSVTAMTNWIGLTNNSNDGMNLLQQIISTASVGHLRVPEARNKARRLAQRTRQESFQGYQDIRLRLTRQARSHPKPVHFRVQIHRSRHPRNL
jgi:hypothetical protein